MKFGVYVPNHGSRVNVGLIARVAHEAESLGFAEVYVNDQITSMQQAGNLMNDEAGLLVAAGRRHLDTFESLTSLAFLAALTQKVELGVHALIVARRNCVTVAKQLANLDNLSGGRLWLSVGIGSVETSQRDFERTFHVSFEKRGEVADEYIKALRVLWEKPKASFHGSYVDFDEVVLYPKPVQTPLPIWVAARTFKALARAAKLGDGWTLTREFPDYIASGIRKLKEYSAQERRSGELPVCYQADTCIAQREEEVRRLSADGIKRISRQGHATYKRPIDGSLKAVLRRSFIGTPRHVRSQIDRYLEAGVDRFKLMFLWREEEDLIGQIRLFSKEVLSSYS